MVGAADAVIFGIQAGIRLYGQARQAYIEKTRERDIVMPLPGLGHEPTFELARAYFQEDQDGRRHLAADPELRVLHHDAMTIPNFKLIHEERTAEYCGDYALYLAMDLGRSEGGYQAADVAALNAISQWRSGDEPHPSAVRRIGGTLIEIGIDYFTVGPGRQTVAGRSPTMAVVRDLLAAVDDHSFSAGGLEGVIEKLFIATLESLGENPKLVGGDPKAQLMVSSVARGLVSDINARLDATPEEDRLFQADRLGEAGGLILRSVLRHGGDTLLRHPSELLGTNAGESALVTSVGAQILDAIIPPDGTGIELDALFTAESLDGVVKSALGVVAEHPELLQLGDHAGLQKIIQEVAGGIAQETRTLGPDLLPDLLRLTLERSAVNLDLVWKADGAGEHLGVTAVRSLLQGLAQQPAAGERWKLPLSRSLLFDAAESVLDEVAENPGMITRELAGRPALQAGIEAVVAELAKVELEKMSARTAANILEISLHAASQRFEFLEEIPGGGGPARVALAHVLDAILAAAFDDSDENVRAAWALSKASALEALVEAAMATLAERGIDEQKLGTLGEVVGEVQQALNDGDEFSVALFVEFLEERLDDLERVDDPVD